MRTVTIVGVGRVGAAFALSLAESGYHIDTLVTRDPGGLADLIGRLASETTAVRPEDLSRIESDILLITTRDSQIRQTAEALAGVEARRGKRFAFHASGALSSEELSALTRAGWKTGSIHPLISISDPARGSDALRSAYFALEGDDEAVEAARVLTKRLGGSYFEVPTASKPLYHAAAVVACGHLVALQEISQRMLAACDIDKGVAREVLFPLIASTVANLRSSDPAQALTGPFARADIDTIRGHIEKLSDIEDREIEAVYRLLGRISVDLARRQGANKERLDEILHIILLDKNTAE